MMQVNAFCWAAIRNGRMVRTANLAAPRRDQMTESQKLEQAIKRNLEVLGYGE